MVQPPRATRMLVRGAAGDTAAHSHRMPAVDPACKVARAVEGSMTGRSTPTGGGSAPVRPFRQGRNAPRNRQVTARGNCRVSRNQPNGRERDKISYTRNGQTSCVTPQDGGFGPEFGMYNTLLKVSSTHGATHRAAKMTATRRAKTRTTNRCRSSPSNKPPTQTRRAHTRLAWKATL